MFYVYYLNVRVMTPRFDLEKNSVYRVSYTVRSSVVKTIAHKYSGDHSWYYTYDLGSISTTRTNTYIMPTDTQYNTRLEFLLGVGTGVFYIEDFILEKLTVN